MAAREWWERYFPPEGRNAGDKVPDHIKSERFWEEYFPPMLVYLNTIQNSDQFWRKAQRIIEALTNEIVLCPFLQFRSFVQTLYNLRNTLTFSSPQIAIKFLEMLPAESDSNIILWYLPSYINNTLDYFDLLFQLSKSEHRLWIEFMNSSGSIDIAIDKWFPMLKLNVEKPDYRQTTLVITIMQLLTDLFTSRPAQITDFPERFAKFFKRLLSFINGDKGAFAYYASDCCLNLLDRLTHAFSSNNYSALVSKFVTSVRNSPSIISCSMSRLFKIIQNDEIRMNALSSFLSTANSSDDFLLAVETIKNTDRRKVSPAVQTLIHIAASSKPFSKTAQSVIGEVLNYTGDFPWITPYIRKTANFVGAAISNGRFLRRAKSILDLYIVLYNTDIFWLRSVLSEVGGLLLATQKVPMTSLLILHPSPVTDRKSIMTITQPMNPNEIKGLLNAKVFEEEYKPIDRLSPTKTIASKKVIVLNSKKISKPTPNLKKNENTRSYGIAPKNLRKLQPLYSV
ncbi:hypothetical protein TVAG_410500 [Trichomonas vaginalis G3]|uniref:Uncharacterized protein n=1 Tax=Trichomonas vaginalis (strain ATCC PRA-98 / G3) TaxID=412133 RepID=A2E8K8_TRIV3|nr:hypothetical protein TVAGG3_0358480 [Trichomonas vaginalis G3]EAY11045.1 hypothetical protein TVAG_410500 [Trichomonas vaginalis G3]KAI5531781.1 hypothetical protein TVAGG3_0358480 [Trichomonas vaginalis G3]|eukprot:XP_001323268.1 hypothetical protein [Trichomonas vaginalis G3]